MHDHSTTQCSIQCQSIRKAFYGSTRTTQSKVCAWIAVPCGQRLNTCQELSNRSGTVQRFESASSSRIVCTRWSTYQWRVFGVPRPLAKTVNPLNLGAKRYDIDGYLPSKPLNHAIVRPNSLLTLACFNAKFGLDYCRSLHPPRCHSRQLRLKHPHPRACS